jgi:P-type Mg2+ transporter
MAIHLDPLRLKGHIVPSFGLGSSHHAMSHAVAAERHASVVMLPLAQLFVQLRSSEHGLTQGEDRQRFLEGGPNEPVVHRRGHGMRPLLAFATNPLVVMLLLTSLVSGILHDVVNAVIIARIVLFSTVLNFVRTTRSQDAAARLREEVAPTATVLREGHWVDISRRELAPGDVIGLAAGDRVPADARLLTSRDLHVQRAALMGESLPAEKDAGDLAAAPPQLAKARNMIFLRTSVVRARRRRRSSPRGQPQRLAISRRT